MAAQVLLNAQNTSSYGDTVSWSSDGRIAVVANEVVYIITLKGASQNESLLPVAVSIIPTPSLPLLTAPVKSVGGISESYDILFDSRLCKNNGPCHFMLVRWSPVRISERNRCVLACLTNFNRILIYQQTSHSQWLIACDLSAIYCHFLVDCNFDVSTTSDLGPAKPVDQYRKQSLLVAMTMSWLPVLLDGTDNQKVAIIAVAVRGGYIILCSLSVPINMSTVPKVLRIIPLPLDSGWASTMEWCVSSTGLFLSVGCSSGQLLVLEWVQELLMTDSQPKISHIWKAKDEMSIDHMTWSTEVPIKDTRWLLFSKGPYLFAVYISLPPNSLPSCFLLLNSKHTLPLTGISILCNNDVISCSLDGSVNRRPLPKSLPTRESSSGDCHVTTAVEELSLIQLGMKSISCSGIASSKNSLFAVANVHTQSVGKRTSRLLLVPLCHPNDIGFAKQLATEVCSWDMYEYMRENPQLWVESVEPPWPLMIQRQIAILLNEDKDQIEDELLMEHSRHLLLEYMKWAGSIKESQSFISLANSASQLLRRSRSNPSDQLLAKKVLSKLSTAGNIIELCPVCDEVIPYTCCMGGRCCNNHYWKRCVLTQCIIHELPLIMSCSMCNSTANLYRDKGWLSHVIGMFQNCPLCGGYFESVL